MHAGIGNVGHHAAIAAFVFAIISFAYYLLASKDRATDKIQIGRLAFLIHALSVMVVITSLFFIIYNHFYEYHYAWSHSSNDLPVYYMISCFWEGQEGSFLLWTFWNMVLCFILLFKKDAWEPEIMAIMMLIQVVLSSMILGIAIGDFKFGSSPFILLREVFFDAPIFATNPEHVPADGKGLNPLLQNYWMVIHPPTLFLGFSLTQIPFVYAIAGLWKGEHIQWIKKSFSWTLICGGILGLGIMMGGFWAYETLNFGGYWNWDPVENAVFVPWLIIVALLHSLTLNEKKGTAIGLSYILAISGFLLILYSTFLTRSGILGSASVHSFTDLGLTAQLLIFLLLFLVGSIILLIVKWKGIPKSQKEVTSYSSEFWIFTGIIVFGLSAFQILLATSFPVINSVGNGLGFNINLAPPADQVKFYSNFQVWVGVLIAFVSAIGQYIWWNKISGKSILKKLINSAIILVGFIAISYVIVFLMDKKQGIFEEIIFSGDDDAKQTYVIRAIAFILLLGTSFFSLVLTVLNLLKIRKAGWKLSGGSLAHIGVALMLIGILFSSGYSKVISINNKGKISKEFTSSQNRENVVLWRNSEYQMGDYSLNYSGKYIQPRKGFDYINEQKIQLLDSVGLGVMKTDDINYKLGDTIAFQEENTYYKIDYKSGSQEFSIYPRIQRNEAMGGILPSPDIKRYFGSDIYSYVASIPLEETPWSDTLYKKLKVRDTIYVNDYVGFIDSVARVDHISGIEVDSSSLAFTVYLTFLGKNGVEYKMSPSALILRERIPLFAPDINDDLGASLTLVGMPNIKTGEFPLAINTRDVDYIILHAERKPFINLLWIGTLVVIIGFIIAAVRRRKEAKRQLYV